MLGQIRIAAAGAALLLASAAAAAMDGVPANGGLDFAVVRDGREIGHHRIVFMTDGERLTVDIDVDVRVRMMFVTVYRFVHRAREIWNGGALTALTSTTDDDGTPHRLELRRVGDSLQGVHNGEAVVAPADSMPTSLWNPAGLMRDRLLNSLRGDTMPTEVAALGPADLNIRGTTVPAQGFLIDAKPDFKRWVWFDGRRTLVRVRLEGRDGSEVTYRLR